MKSPSNKEVFLYGYELNNWACDLNSITGELQSNGGVEHLIEYKEKYYTVVTDWNGEFIFKPEAEAIEMENELDEV